MKSGTIVFAGTDLALWGDPIFTLKRTPEPAAPARATHRRVEVVVSVELTAEMPATVWARARGLQDLLAARPEGLLEIRDENGTALSWMARAGETSLPSAIARRSGRVDMSFTAIETVADELSPLAMTIDPMDGSPIIPIERPADWGQSVRVARADSRSAMRQEIASTITFTARTAYADMLADTPTRAEFLLAEAERLNGLASKEARLQFAGFDEVVQFESFTARPSPGWEWIDLEAQARHNALPGETVAEVQFTVDVNEDPATGETRTTVTGNVEAADKTTADEKVNAILATYRTGRRVVKISKKDTYLDGDDADTAAEWTGLEFTLEFSQGSDVARYTVDISTHTGSDGCRTSYSGTAYASSLLVLLTTVAAAAAGKHPVELSSEIKVSYATDDEGVAQIMQATFAYDYQTAAGSIHGTVTRATSQGQFGDWMTSVTGRISAPTLSNAITTAHTFISAGVILRTNDETPESSFVGTGTPTEAFATLSFSYAWATDHTNTAIQYEESNVPDYTRMIQQTTISGICWAVNKANAETAVNTLMTSIMGTANPSQKSLSHSHERQTIGGSSTTRWLSFRFSQSFDTGITGTIAHDIIEASFSIQRTGQVDHVPMTEIPLAMPVYQLRGGTLSNPTGFGHNIGRLTGSGNVRARQKATAIAWGQATVGRVSSVAGGIYGAADPPDERLTENYLPFNGEDIACYEFNFNYGYRYASGLTGLM